MTGFSSTTHCKYVVFLSTKFIYLLCFEKEKNVYITIIKSSLLTYWLYQRSSIDIDLSQFSLLLKYLKWTLNIYNYLSDYYVFEIFG